MAFNSFPIPTTLLNATAIANAEANALAAAASQAAAASSAIQADDAATAAAASAAGIPAAGLIGIVINSRAEALLAHIPPGTGSIIVTEGDVVLFYQYDATGTALETADGATWSPLGVPTPLHWAENTTPGTTDMADALQSALAFAGEVTRTIVAAKIECVRSAVYVPPGRYYVRPNVVQVPSGVELYGESMFSTSFISTGAGKIIQAGGGPSRAYAGVVLRDLSVFGDATSFASQDATPGQIGIYSDNAVFLSGLNRVLVVGADTNIKIIGFAWGIYDAYSLGARTHAFHGIDITASQMIGGRYEYSGDDNIRIEVSTLSGAATASTFQGVAIQNSQKRGVYATDFNQLTFRDCFFEGNNRGGNLLPDMEFDNTNLANVGSVLISNNSYVNTHATITGNMTIITRNVQYVTLTNNWMRDSTSTADYDYFWQQEGVTEEAVYYGNRTQFDSHAGPDYAINQLGTIKRAFVFSPEAGQQAGFRNMLINGGFDVWQNGTSFGGSSVILTADRWYLNLSGATGTLTREDFTPGQTDVPGNPKHYLKIVTTVANDNAGIFSRVRGVHRFSGSTVTVSGYMYKAGGGTMNVIADENFGTGGSPSTQVRQSTVVTLAAATWTPFSKTFRLASTAGKTLGTDENDALIITLGNPNNETEETRFAINQLEFGPISTQYESVVERGGYVMELERCKAYREVLAADDANGEFATVFGHSTTEVRGMISYTEKLKIPTVTSSGSFILAPSGAVGTMSALAFTRIGRKTAGISATVTGATLGLAGALRANASTAAKIIIDTGL